MRVAVYTIAKNEAKHAAIWAEAWREADGLFVADTGSDDDTVRILHRHHVSVSRIFVAPWRFDVARNAALVAVPQWPDLCIVADMDEWPVAGWRQALEATYTEALAAGHRLTRIYHDYMLPQSLSHDGIPKYMEMERIHSRTGWYWKYAAHEGLYPYPSNTPQETAFCEGFVIEHHPDDAKPRAYFDLCRISYEENPGFARPCLYWGRELVNHHIYDEAIQVLSQYWSLRGAGDHEIPAVIALLREAFDGLGAEYPAWFAPLVSALESVPRLQAEARRLVPFARGLALP